MEALDQPGVGHDEPAAVEDVVRDQPVEEPLDVTAELGGLRLQLGQRLGQAVGDLHVAPAQRPQQLVLVVARHAERVAGGDHAHHQAQDAGGVRAAVDEVTDEHGPPALRVRGTHRAAVGVALDEVAELAQQGLELGPAAVHVADDVERPGLVPQVVEQPGTRDAGGGDLVLGPEHVDRTEALALQAAQTTAQRVALAPEHVRAESAV